MEQTNSEVSLRTAVIILIAVITALAVIGLYVGNKFFWKPVDARTVAEKRFDSIETAYKNNPKDKQAALAYAIALYTQGKNGAAEKLFAELARKNPGDNAILVNYASFKKDTGDRKKAAELFEKVLKKSPYFVPANVQYAVLLREQGKYEEALTKIDNALRIEPAAADILLEKAKIYIAMKDGQKAKEYLQRALKFVPNYEEAQKLMKQLEQEGK
ncbi:hypothetical protein Tfer_0073 [Thermincola ferriacetica]|uniref:Uncharacterized protein n=1 Tax=Thermincola ferriacetica TaxID=281456 RepID=A0A0L6W6K9_9FIRM|nr:tetratricopeptide repeat protein [Thermincola ferriacetica]KNZ71003.1 hypothetical protein Tfer_0073 [Thermincola ferriacetica]